MRAGKRDHTNVHVGHRVRRMALVRPLDQRRQDPAAGKTPVGGNRDPPFECAARHRMYLAAIDRTSAARGDDVVGARDPMDQPRRLGHLDRGQLLAIARVVYGQLAAAEGAETAAPKR